MGPPDKSPMLSPTPTGRGWRMPALVVAAMLVSLVLVARLGGPNKPLPTTAPTAVAVQQTPPPPPTDAQPPIATSIAAREPTAGPIAIGRLTGVIRRSADGLTYADGIPTGISGVAVYRVRDALLVPLGRTLLVGGWYVDRPCARGGRCPSPTISDVPLVGGRVGDLTTDFVALDSTLLGTGAHIVLATVESDPRCSIFSAGDCLPRLRVLAAVWSLVG